MPPTAPYTLTEHAATEMVRRQIPRDWVDAAMSQPEQIVAGVGGRKVHQSRVMADGKTFLVRLIVEDWHQPPVVVTVYRTNKIDKYWRQT